MRRLLAVIVVALAVPAVASAKGPVSAEVCGPDDCRRVDVMPHFDGSEPAPDPGPYYQLRLDFGGGHVPRGIYYEPQAGLVSYVGDFGYTAWARLRIDTAGLKPYPAPRITAARIGARKARGDASSYLSLLTVEGPSVAPRTTSAALPIVLEPARPSPWTESRLLYYPDDDVLQRDGTLVKLPAAIAADLEAARPLTTDGERIHVPWLPLGIGLIGLLAVFALRWRAQLALGPPSELTARR